MKSNKLIDCRYACRLCMHHCAQFKMGEHFFIFYLFHIRIRWQNSTCSPSSVVCAFKRLFWCMDRERGEVCVGLKGMSVKLGYLLSAVELKWIWKSLFICLFCDVSYTELKCQLIQGQYDIIHDLAISSASQELFQCFNSPFDQCGKY